MESGIEDAALFLNSLSNLKQSYLIVLECVEEAFFCSPLLPLLHALATSLPYLKQKDCCIALRRLRKIPLGCRQDGHLGCGQFSEEALAGHEKQ